MENSKGVVIRPKWFRPCFVTLKACTEQVYILLSPGGLKKAESTKSTQSRSLPSTVNIVLFSSRFFLFLKKSFQHFSLWGFFFAKNEKKSLPQRRERKFFKLSPPQHPPWKSLKFPFMGKMFNLWNIFIFAMIRWKSKTIKWVTKMCKNYYYYHYS